MREIWFAVLLALTFAIGIGSALTQPAWSAIVPELVPREDMVQAIALNGIGYNLTRAIGPATLAKIGYVSENQVLPLRLRVGSSTIRPRSHSLTENFPVC